jgi:hypothetical protein
MKSTGIVRKPVFTKEGRIGVVKDLIIENSQERLSTANNTIKGFASPDWWISALEIELDEPVKNEFIAARKLTPATSKAAETFALKLTGFSKGAVNFTERGVELSATRTQAGDNIGTLDAFFKPAKITRPSLR